MRRRLGLPLLLLLLAAAWFLWPASDAERAAWLADFARLEAHTAVAYANLGDRLASRGLSPRELDRRARTALAGARSRRQARAAVAEFVGAFDDWHFRAEAPYGAARRLLRRLIGKQRPPASEAIARQASGEQACAQLGARDRRAGKLAWAELPDYRPLDRDPATHPFPAGLLARAGEPRLAILRIGLFDELAFPALCAATWERFRATLPAATTACDEGCQDEFSQALEGAFLARFAAQLEELAAAGATALLIDLTDNGGGSGIVSPMLRMVTARPMRQRPFGFVRHPHSVARLGATAEEFRHELARSDLSPRQREIVGTALERAEAAVRAAGEPCDLSGLWQLASAAELPCSNVGRSLPWIDEVAPGELVGLGVRSALGASEETAREGVWRGELFVLVNRSTASASEDFVASLQDAGGAVIVGERTLGVGCGYTNGGIRLELPALGLTVRAPDCVRYRADGRNEAEGVLPDLPVAWSAGDDARERAAKAIAVLPD